MLQDARVEASLGSLRAAVASSVLAKGVAADSVMRVADWVSSCTLFANYIRLLPTETLGELADICSVGFIECLIVVCFYCRCGSGRPEHENCQFKSCYT